MKQLLKIGLYSLLIVGSLTAISCKDYGDEVYALQDQVDSLTNELRSAQTALESSISSAQSAAAAAQSTANGNSSAISAAQTAIIKAIEEAEAALGAAVAEAEIVIASGDAANAADIMGVQVELDSMIAALWVAVNSNGAAIAALQIQLAADVEALNAAITVADDAVKVWVRGAIADGDDAVEGSLYAMLVAGDNAVSDSLVAAIVEINAAIAAGDDGLQVQIDTAVASASASFQEVVDAAIIAASAASSAVINAGDAQTLSSAQSALDAAAAALASAQASAVAGLQGQISSLSALLSATVTYQWLDDSTIACGQVGVHTQTKHQFVDGVQNVIVGSLGTRQINVSWVSSSTVVTETSTENHADVKFDVNGDGDFLDPIQKSRVDHVYSRIVSSTGEVLDSCINPIANNGGQWYTTGDIDPDVEDGIIFTGSWISNYDDVVPTAVGSTTHAFTYTNSQYYEIDVNGAVDSPEAAPSEELIAALFAVYYADVVAGLPSDYLVTVIGVDSANRRIYYEVTVPEVTLP